MHKLLVFIILLFVTSKVIGQGYQSTVAMHVPYLSDRVTISGKPMIYYELHITNFSSDTIHLKNLHIINTRDSSRLYSMGAEDWKTHTMQIGNSKIKSNTLAAGHTMIVYLEVALPKSATSFIHQLEIEIKGKLISIKSPSIDESQKSPLVIGAPLKDGPWAAVYNPRWERGHRRVIYTMDGKARIPGRYAIDFILLNAQGQFAKGDDNVIQNWFGYAADVLAVKDGIILSARNDFAESATLSDHADSTPDKAAGNYISIDIGGGKIVFYEHLKPGSVKVKPGQKVKKGEVIASLGFTGQTTGPHLHFHIADANSTLGAEGLSFEFEKFTLLGTYTQFEDFGKTSWTPEKEAHRSLIKIECPGSNSVIRF